MVIAILVCLLQAAPSDAPPSPRVTIDTPPTTTVVASSS
jgi:hypothetical protein